MKNFRRYLVLALVVLLCIIPCFSAQVVVSPRIGNVEYEMKTTPDSLAVQLGLDENPILVDDDNYSSRRAVELLLATSDPGYVLVPGDVINISYLERTGTTPVNLSVSVPIDGKIRIPGISEIDVGGMTFSEARAAIMKVLIEYNRYSEPVINLTSLGLFSVLMKGEVVSNKYVTVSGMSRLADVMYLASANASSRNVSITDKSGNTVSYDLYSAMRRGEGDHNPRLRPGDTITVGVKDRSIIISGAVSNPGTYQILSGENLQALLKDYAGGLESSASGKISIQRSSIGGYVDVINVDSSTEIALLDGDIVYVEPSVDNLSSVSIEGALLSQSTTNMIQGDKNEKYYYRFVPGETVYDMLSAISQYFIPSSNLENAYLVRNGEMIALDFQKILYDGASTGNMLLEAGDCFYIPFNQMLVSVNGAVANPGVYGYVPGRTMSYYINLAGGLTGSAKGEKYISIVDKEGNKLSKDDTIPAETVITVEENVLQTKIAPTVAVVGLVSSIVGIVASIITASVNIANAGK